MKFQNILYGRYTKFTIISVQIVSRASVIKCSRFQQFRYFYIKKYKNVNVWVVEATERDHSIGQ